MGFDEHVSRGDDPGFTEIGIFGYLNISGCNLRGKGGGSN